MSEKARCLVCEKGDWENVDEHRIVPKGMCICKNCGFVTYPERISNEEKLKEHYRENYRPPPSIINMYTGQRKLNFHAAFLEDEIERLLELKKKDKTPVIGEVGSAFGMVLSWLGQIIPGADLNGTEWTTSFKRVAMHEYGIKLTDYLPKKKYDLLMSYKVAEHQVDADKKLMEMHDMLNDDGILYISVPIWFKSMTNFGVSGFDLEYYYHPDHINAWTEEHFEFVLHKAGFKITHKNDTIYDNTYLCRKMTEDEKRESSKIDIFQYEKVKEVLPKIKKAFGLYKGHRYSEAIEIFPDFPLAWMAAYEHKRKELNDKGWQSIEDNFIKPMIKSCPRSADILAFAADINMRYTRYNEAITLLKTALEMKPDAPNYLIELAQCFIKLGDATIDPNEKIGAFVEARNIYRHIRIVSAQHVPDAVNWLYKLHSLIPYKGEKND